VDVVTISDWLRDSVRSLAFGPPVSYVYNPLEYAWPAHLAYLQRFGQPRKEAIFLGMNPGPWGMAQTGIPFGEVAAVRDWLGISAPIGRPEHEHPKRPVTGLACARSEVSGRRLWGWARSSFGSPERFFSRFFIANYCPLLFLEANGRNLTPDRLPAAERRPLEEVCDQALRDTVGALGSKLVIGIGAFAARCAGRALTGSGVEVGRVLHPSPASPAANRGWSGQMVRQLAEIGIAVP